MHENKETGKFERAAINIFLEPSEPFNDAELKLYGPAIPLDVNPTDVVAGSFVQVTFPSTPSSADDVHVPATARTLVGGNSMGNRPSARVAKIKYLGNATADRERKRRHVANGDRALLVLVVGINQPFVDTRSAQFCKDEATITNAIWGEVHSNYAARGLFPPIIPPLPPPLFPLLSPPSPKRVRRPPTLPGPDVFKL